MTHAMLTLTSTELRNASSLILNPSAKLACSVAIILADLLLDLLQDLVAVGDAQLKICKITLITRIGSD